MTNATMALTELAEKEADVTVLHQMVQAFMDSAQSLLQYRLCAHLRAC